MMRLAALGDNLREALIVSQVKIVHDPAALQPTIELEPASGEKCAPLLESVTDEQ